MLWDRNWVFWMWGVGESRVVVVGKLQSGRSSNGAKRSSVDALARVRCGVVIVKRQSHPCHDIAVLLGTAELYSEFDDNVGLDSVYVH